MHSKYVLHFKIKSHPFIDDLLCTFYTHSIFAVSEFDRATKMTEEREKAVCA